jgi:hypothetical protein
MANWANKQVIQVPWWGWASTFLGLTDTPASYTGQALKGTRVNAGETALEFFTLGWGTGTVTSVWSADASVTITNPTTTPDLAVVKSPKLTTARTISTTGDVTYTSWAFDGTANVTGTATIANSAVTLAKQADVATATIFYRKTAWTWVPEVQTLATLKTDLWLTGTNSGDQTITLTSDVTWSGTGSFATTIANNVVTLAKMAQVATATFLGRNTASTGNVEVLSVATVQGMLGTSGTNTGDVTLAGTPNYITIAGQVITRALIDLTTHVTGLLPFANIANVATSTVMYRKTAATWPIESQTLATLKTDLGLTGTNSGDQTITLTGDITGSGTGSFATTLATVNSNVGSFGLAGSVAQFVVNAKGLITSAVNVAISITASQVSDFSAGVRAVTLTGLSLATSQVIASTDTVLLALGYLQAQITALTTTVSGKQNTITLTTTGTSGAATLIGATLNIPNYASGGWSGITRSVSSISTNTSAGATAITDYVYLCTATLTITLPTAVGNTNRYAIKNVGGTTTIATTSSQTIDGSTTATLSVQYVTVEVVSDGANWNII